MTLSKQCGVVYSRFIANHSLYSSVDYIGAKRHVNHNVSFQHHRFMYGVIIGLLSIKSECLWNSVLLQYCNCKCYNVVLIQPIRVCARPLFRDTDFNTHIYFLVEVEQTGMQIAIHPNQIRKKCISLTLEDKEYFCPLPYKITDN